MLDRPGKALAPPQQARGVSLLESLLALLLLAVTVLGTVAGFVQALRSSHSALLHAQAQYLVSDLAERIRSNPQARAAYVAPAGGAAPDCDPAPCSPDARAASDLQRWRQAVAATLTDAATARLTFQPGDHNPDRYRIELRWRDPAGPAEASLQVLVEVAA
jgi:type IV pilus assembly protein PilV